MLSSKPKGAITGTFLSFTILSIIDWSILVGVPTKPNSLFSLITLIILLSLELIVSLLQDCFLRAPTISWLNSIRTFSTT